MATELHSAFWFHCEECGAENFVRALEGGLELAPEAAAMHMEDSHLLAMNPIDDSGDAASQTEEASQHDGHEDPDLLFEALQQRVVLCPRYVTCSTCGHSSEVEVEPLDATDED